MRRLEAALEVHHNNIVNNDYDGVLILTGDEGKGKSNLLLHIIDWWYNKTKGGVSSEDIKSVGLEVSQFSEALKDAKKYDLIANDEAGDISNKRSMSRMNVLLNQAYQVIRGDNLFTILVLPSVFDLDGFFAKRRARGLIHVTKRGRFNYYSQRRLRRIIALNQNRILKTLNVTMPTFNDTFPKYKGVLIDPYLEKKQEKMQRIREELYNNLKDTQEGKTEYYYRDVLISQIKEKLGTSETASLVGLSTRQIQNIAKKCETMN